MSKGQQYFDQLAEQWDELRAADPAKIRLLVTMAGFDAGDRVLDIGCGTGVLVPYVKEAIGETGRITAVDFSDNMIARAREIYKDIKGSLFLAADIMEFQQEETFDKIVCLNFFPHVSDKQSFLIKLRGMLTEDGSLVIMHDISRDTVNEIHEGSDVVRNDRLPPGEKTADMLQNLNYLVLEVVDNDEMYFIKACRR
jgi:cyclopropane fatty-acyl-phospholipid synthase-like methyltransferase